MKRIITISILSVAMLIGCTKVQKEPTVGTFTNSESESVKQTGITGNIDDTEILSLLDEEEVTISGIYGKFEKGTDHVIRGSEDNKREFSGKLKDITNIQTLEENGKTLVYLLANVEGQFFKTTSPCGIQAIIEKDSDDKLYISSTTLLEDMLPDITPSVPFEIDYIFEPSGTEPTTIMFKLNGKEYEANKELYTTIDGAVTEYDPYTDGRDGGGTYHITVPLSKDYIQSLKLDYSNVFNHTVIEYTNIRMIATLKNGLKIYGRPKIFYVLASDFYNLEKPADYWVFEDLEYWNLDSKRKK